MKKKIKWILTAILAINGTFSAYSQAVVHDPANMANNIIMQAESMEEAVEQKLIAQEQLVQFTAQLEMFKDKADKFKKLAGIVAASVELIEAIEYGTNAFQKITQLRENVTNMDDLTYEEKYKCIMTLVDCGYVITQKTKHITALRDRLKSSTGEEEVTPEQLQECIDNLKEKIKEEVVRAICCVDDFIFNAQFQRTNYDLYCAGLCMGRAKEYWKNGKAVPLQARRVSIKMPNGKTIYYNKPYYR